jgi:tetratricopeptide (TPR) repeat protein
MAWDSSFRTARRAAAIGIVAAFIGLASPAIADDLQKCHDESGDAAIAACTRAIGAGKLSKRNQAIAYTSRGVEWRAKRQLDRAIADHSQAIKLDPSLSEAFYNRGNAYGDKGENDRAITDYDQASGSIPNSPVPSTTADWPGARRATRWAAMPTSPGRSSSISVRI